MAAAKQGRGPSGSERSERSRAIHTNLSDAAAAINALHARVLADVIEARVWNIHRDIDRFSAPREWLMATVDFHTPTAAPLAAIARTSGKFRALAEAAVSGAARIDAVAAAVRRLDKTRALRLYATAPYREPEPSPFDPAVRCATPEALVVEYCRHAPV